MQQKEGARDMRLTIRKASLRFDQQRSRLERWKKRKRKKIPSFVVSSARACPLREGVLARPRIFQADKTGLYSHKHRNMNFFLLLFLVFFAPLLLFAGQFPNPGRLQPAQ